VQTMQEVDGPCDCHPRGGHLLEKLCNVSRRQSGAMRGAHDGVLLRQCPAIQSEPIDMADEVRAYRGVHRPVGEYLGDERRLVIRHNNPSEIKNDVQDDLLRKHLTID
jgi:hypothetical protein